MNHSRVFDGILVIAGIVQVGFVDFTDHLWQDILTHPIQALVALAAICLAIARTTRMIQKIRRDKRRANASTAKT